MEEQNREIQRMKRHVNILSTICLVLAFNLVGTTIRFQVERSIIRSYYQSILSQVQEMTDEVEDAILYVEDITREINVE